MADDYIFDFDITLLLRQNDLDVRKIAKTNPALTIGEYFNSLSKFAPFTVKNLDTLNKISTLKANDKDFQSLAEIKTMLTDIGCYKLLPDIDEIISIGKRGHNRFAADYVEKLRDNIERLCTRIMAAKKTEASKTAAGAYDAVDTGSEIQFSSEAQVLSKVLKLLDHEEAARKMRILAVDDAPSMLKTISSVLENDYKVYGLTNPAMVEKFLQQITPELFLLDYQMPEISGFDLVPVIRSFGEHKDTPVIFLTSMGTMDHVSAAYALGACDFIVKPFQDNVLREKVAKHIVRKKLY